MFIVIRGFEEKTEWCWIVCNGFGLLWLILPRILVFAVKSSAFSEIIFELWYVQITPGTLCDFIWFQTKHIFLYFLGERGECWMDLFGVVGAKIVFSWGVFSRHETFSWHCLIGICLFLTLFGCKWPFLALSGRDLSFSWRFLGGTDLFLGVVLGVDSGRSANIRDGGDPETPDDENVRHAHDADRGEKQRQRYLKNDRNECQWRMVDKSEKQHRRYLKIDHNDECEDHIGEKLHQCCWKINGVGYPGCNCNGN